MCAVAALAGGAGHAGGDGPTGGYFHLGEPLPW
jgi:hypothetical protein